MIEVEVKGTPHKMLNLKVKIDGVLKITMTHHTEPWTTLPKDLLTNHNKECQCKIITEWEEVSVIAIAEVAEAVFKAVVQVNNKMDLIKNLQESIGKILNW